MDCILAHGGVCKLVIQTFSVTCPLVFVLWSLLPLTEQAAPQLLLKIPSPKASIKPWEIFLAEDLDTQWEFFIPQFKLNKWNSYRGVMNDH